MGRSDQIDHFDARAVFRGLLDGADYRNRVVGSCIYRCPRCAHRIRFRWRSFFRANGRSPFQRKLRRVFDDLTPTLPADEQGRIDFHCPGCQAPTRIIYGAHDYTTIAYHFDVYAALVGAGMSKR
ncbi:MAG: hypothetical protein F4X02_05705 [Chloroflexi bacterium]|nr:hypothetical protein [Chloroflexota bacterium]